MNKQKEPNLRVENSFWTHFLNNQNITKSIEPGNSKEFRIILILYVSLIFFQASLRNS